MINDINELHAIVEVQHGYELACLTSAKEPKEVIRHQSRMFAYERILQALDGAEVDVGGDMHDRYRSLSRTKLRADDTLREADEQHDAGIGVQ